MQLVIGNKNYSSWSLRPWLLMQCLNIPFQEVLIPLDEPDTPEKIKRYSPAGKVPILIDGELRIWETVAIIEYLAEKFPARNVWPEDTHLRSRARVISAEMHAGFADLRAAMPMNMRETITLPSISEAVQADIERIVALWSECLETHEEAGPFLFGPFCAADAMFAPIVSRFETYKVSVSANIRAYLDTIMTIPSYEKWAQAAEDEPWTIEKYQK